MAETPVQRAIRARLDRAPAVSKRRLAGQIGVKADTLIAWERGTTPRDFQLVKMAPHLEVSVDELREKSTDVDGPLPKEVVAALRRLVDIADVVPAMSKVNDKTPDLISALEDLRALAQRLDL